MKDTFAFCKICNEFVRRDRFKEHMKSHPPRTNDPNPTWPDDYYDKDAAVFDRAVQEDADWQHQDYLKNERDYR